MSTALNMRLAMLVIAAIFLGARPAAAQLEYVGNDDSAGLSKAVVVKAQHLAFTSQIFPIDENGAVIGRDDVDLQSQAVLKHLADLLAVKMEGQLEDVAKLAVYITDPSSLQRVTAQIAKAFPEGKKPAVSFVVTALRVPGCLVAMDAVARDRRAGGNLPGFYYAWRFNQMAKFGSPPDMAADMMVVPTDRLILVSGQAEPGEFRESIAKTCLALKKTAKWAGGEDTDIDQVKVFMSSVNDAGVVMEEASKAFEQVGKFPAISFVQWTNSGPTEIEVIAHGFGSGGQADSEKPIQFLTPPWMTESPVYSKVAVTNSEKLIFTSGLYGKPGSSGEEQVTSLFAELEKIANDAGSDLRHLAKATYYVANDDVSAKLNSLRPKYYDPKRPPAASKASVQGVGVEGCGITLDMIAVPSGK